MEQLEKALDAQQVVVNDPDFFKQDAAITSEALNHLAQLESELEAAFELGRTRRFKESVVRIKMKYKLLAASILASLSTSAMSATYKLEELGGLSAQANYYVDVSENGHIIGLANGTYKLPVDVSYIDFSKQSLKTPTTEKKRVESIDKEITFTLDDIQNNDAVNTMLMHTHLWICLYTDSL